MATIVVNHGAMSTASSDLSGDAAYLQSVLDDLDSKIKTLAANWEGDAQQAYLAAKAQWTAAMTEIREVLGAISQLLSATNDTFRNIDVKGAGMWA